MHTKHTRYLVCVFITRKTHKIKESQSPKVAFAVRLYFSRQRSFVRDSLSTSTYSYILFRFFAHISIQHLFFVFRCRMFRRFLFEKGPRGLFLSKHIPGRYWCCCRSRLIHTQHRARVPGIRDTPGGSEAPSLAPKQCPPSHPTHLTNQRTLLLIIVVCCTTLPTARENN